MNYFTIFTNPESRLTFIIWNKIYCHKMKFNGQSQTRTDRPERLPLAWYHIFILIEFFIFRAWKIFISNQYIKPHWNLLPQCSKRLIIFIFFPSITIDSSKNTPVNKLKQNKTFINIYIIWLLPYLIVANIKRSFYNFFEHFLSKKVFEDEFL